MKYMLMFIGDDDAWAAVPEKEREEGYKRIGEWFAEHGRTGKIVGGEELQHRRTAATVRFGGNGSPVVTDGPFMEMKELIGGYALLEVKDREEAIAIAKTWPGRSTVEVRPLVERASPSGA